MRLRPSARAGKLFCHTFNRSEFLINDNGTALHENSGIRIGTDDFQLTDTAIIICENVLRELTNKSRSQPVPTQALPGFTASSILTIATTSLSIVALFLLFSIYVLLPKLRNVPGKTMMMLAMSLFLAQLIFLTGVTQTQHGALCIALAAIIHYFYTASFAWMSCMAFDVTMTFSAMNAFQSNSRRNFKFVLYSLFSWSYPAVLVAVSLMLDLIWKAEVSPYNPGYGDRYCWISNVNGLLILFVVPVGAHLLANLIMFVLTVYNLHKAVKATKKVRKGDKANVWISLKLALVMGGTWVIAYAWIATGSTFVVLEYLYIIMNGLQGVFIFVAFACRPYVWKLLRKRITGEGAKGSASSAYRTSSTMSETITKD